MTDSARAFREARSSAGLSHRNVVAVFDVVEEAGHIWLVMEHVQGRSLSQIIKQDGALDPAVVADIGAQVADGLSALHADGIIHRDVKPGNVLIREDGVAKISDFGIARTAGDATLTQAGFLTGTPSYFSPALARGAEPTPADDVWALGATLFAAVEGHSPYAQRKNPMEVLHEINAGRAPRPQRAEFLEPALQRMLDRDPVSRWTMADAGHTPAPPRGRAPPGRDTGSDTLRAPRRTCRARRAPPRASRRRQTPAASVTRSSRHARLRRPCPFGRDGRGARPAPCGRLALLLVIGGIAFAVTQLDLGGAATGTSGEPSAKDSHDGQRLDEVGRQQPSGDGLHGERHLEGRGKEAFVRDYYAKAPGGSERGVADARRRRCSPWAATATSGSGARSSPSRCVTCRWTRRVTTWR